MYTIRAAKQGEQDFDAQRFLPGLVDTPTIRLYYYLGAARSEDGQVVLVDTGFREEDAQRRGCISTLDPREPLTRMGIHADEVQHVILTHLHWDHCSALGLYPRATFYVQRREMEFWTGPLARFPQIKGVAGPVAALVDLDYQGRVHYMDGDAEVLPGIQVALLGGHTPGSQAVVVQTSQGRAVVAGDALIFYLNLEHNVVGSALDTPAALLALDRLRSLASSPELLVASHDPANMDRFPKSADGVLEIA